MSDQEDYLAFLNESGLTEELMQEGNRLALLDSEADQAGIEIRKSVIHGLGVFATRDFSSGDLISNVRSNGKWTISGRYINHSHCPSVRVGRPPNGEFYVYAARQIGAGEELTANYREVKQEMDGHV